MRKVPTPDVGFHHTVVGTTWSYGRWLLTKYDDLSAGDSISYIRAASYLNFLITNGLVFIPAYWHEGKPGSMKAKDERVRAILQAHFPDRTIVQVGPRAINRPGGGAWIAGRNSNPA